MNRNETHYYECIDLMSSYLISSTSFVMLRFCINDADVNLGQVSK